MESHTPDRPRPLPPAPPTDRPLRVLIDSDTGAEVDDQHAIALAILRPDRLNLVGFVATHFADHGGPQGTARSAAQIENVLEAAGMAGKYLVRPGGDPLAYDTQPQRSPGAEFIIEQALADDDPLWVVGLGACSNIASALLIEPAIAERMVVVWHSRCKHWPARFASWNGLNDLSAVRALSRSRVPLVWFDTGTYLRLTMEVSEERVRPRGRLGTLLHEIRLDKPFACRPDKAMFDVGDIAYLIDPSLCESEQAAVPEITPELEFTWPRDNGQMHRIYQINNAAALDLLYDVLKQHAG